MVYNCKNNTGITLCYQQEILKKMADVNSGALIRKELEKSQNWFDVDVFKKLLDWAVIELSKFADDIKIWFNSFFVGKVSC